MYPQQGKIILHAKLCVSTSEKYACTIIRRNKIIQFHQMEKNSFYRKTAKKNLQTKKRIYTSRNYDSATEIKSFLSNTMWFH